MKNCNHTGGIEPKEIEFYLYDHLGNTRVVYQPKVAGANLELVINYVADYFPYGKILKEYVNTGSGDPEKFLTTQHERDQETGFDYRGARYYDADIARFLSTDPWQTKYPAWSTYNYVMGNPIMLIDPTGKGSEDIIIGESFKKNSAINKAFNTFAQTEEGIAFLSDYAKKGDVIAGHTYAEDGKYHKEGIDLVFQTQRFTSTRGTTGAEMNGDRANIIFSINDNPIIYSGDNNTYDMRILNRPYLLALPENMDYVNKGIMSITGTIFHEAFIHGEMRTQDYLDDRSFNYSNIDAYIKNTYKKDPQHWDHIQIQRGSNHSKQLFNTKGLSGVSSANSILNAGYSENELKDMMWNFSGSWK